MMTAIRNLIFLIVAISLLLAVSDRRLLIWQHKVLAGSDYYVEGHGSFSNDDQDSLVCSYWTGWSVKKSVFWYSANGIFGKDQCPVIFNAG